MGTATLDLESYLVGGAVRDGLLGLPVKDKDYVVVGASVEQMLARGFQPVGADFPVFLHPESKAEYALARTERKSGRGYAGFSFHAAPDVTLVEDLQRRDLTINAMALAPDGRIVDPYGGQADLQARVLRHVSAAFVEDPLRVLRIARFAARYASLGFRIAPETRVLLRDIVSAGEVSALTAERVYVEIDRALVGPTPSVFLRTLRDCGALRVVLPEVDALYGIPQRADYHPEIDCGIHQEMVCDAATTVAPGDAGVAWCALTHDLGKALTDPAQWPSHRDHEAAGVPSVKALYSRLKAPRELSTVAMLTCAEHLNVHRVRELNPGTLCDLLSRMDAWRKPERVRTIALAAKSDAWGRLGLHGAPYPQAAFLQAAHAAAMGCRVADLAVTGLSGEAIALRLRERRIAQIRQVARQP